MSMLKSLALRAAVILPLLLAAPAGAQSAADRLFPPGGQRGATVTLTFPAMEKVESATLVVDGEGLKPLGPFVKGVGKVEIAPEAEPGVRQLRLVGPAAATEPRPFMVGVLPEVLEAEPNDSLDKAQRLEQLPLTLNGAIPKPGDTDNYRVALKKGDCLVVASESRLLAGPIYLALTVRDAQGRTVGVDVDNRRLDPVFTCTAPADGEYTLQLTDVTSNMGNVDAHCHYRLHLTTGPWLDFALPPSVARGSSARLTVHGWNLGKPGPGTAELEAPVPSEGETFHLTAFDAPNRLPLAMTEGPELPEAEPNDRAEQAQPISVPGAAHGTFGRRGDADFFRFTVKAKDRLRIQVVGREVDSLADPRFILRNAEGRVVLQEDDAPRSRDPRAEWTVPADGEYVLQVEDLAGSSRSGPSSYYRLLITPMTPELSAVAATPTAVVKPGEKLEWNVTLYQSFQPDEIELRLEGLPAGVTAEPVKVAALKDRTGQSSAKLVLQAAADAQPGFAVVRLVAVTAGESPRTVPVVWLITGDGGNPLGPGPTAALVALVPAPEPPAEKK
ncbi:MAG: hypothetical protein ACK47B_26535 [Armatimonadota bacterium]